jgi:hypothetical protein
MNLKLLFILFNMVILLSSCSESRVTIQNLKLLNGGDGIVVSTPTSNAIVQDGFDLTVPVSSDNNSNSSGIIFYCSETDTPGCDPSTGDSQTLIKNGEKFEISITGLSSPYEPGEVINYIVVISDPDGVSNAPSVRQITLANIVPSAINIFRSVGFSNTSSLDNHNTGADSISIIGDQITFSTPVVDIVGIGDIIVYDGGAKYAFIHSRTSSTVYTIKKADGFTEPDVQTINNDWEIFRAYTSLSDAENGIENSGITGTPDFDTWSGGKNLVASNEQWNIVLYNDAEFVLTGSFSIDGWETSKTNNLNIYTPYKSTEVGTGQRHNGAWNSSGVKISCSEIVINLINDSFITIDGVQISRNYLGAGYTTAISIGGSSDGIILKNNLIGLANTGTGVLRGISVNSSIVGATFKAFNNIVFTMENPLGTTTGFYLVSSTLNSFVYSNTLVGHTNGFKYLNNSSANTCRLKNNLITNSISTSNTHSSQVHSDSSNNISDDTGEMGTNSKSSQAVIYNSKETYDFRIAGNSYSAIGAGVDLSSDSDLPLTLDIIGQVRNRWDVGASMAATAIFRSVGPGNTSSLKSTSDRELSIVVNSDGHTQMILSNGTTDLPLNIGVGDVIQYDQDNVGGVDTLAFIHERIDQNNYLVKNKLGLNAAITTANSTIWDVFRAYTSLSDAESATNENTGIAATLQNFDTWQSTGAVPHEVSTNNEQWNFALYADAPESGVIRFQYWDTSSLHFIKIFTPFSSLEVGESQRHLGVWNTSKFHLVCSDMASCLSSSMNGFIIDGLQIENQLDLNLGNPSGVSVGGTEGSSDGVNIARNNIVKSTGTGTGGALDIGIRLSSGGMATSSYAINNISYGFGIGLSNPGGIGNYYYYNNTIFGSEEGISLASGGSFKYLKNNLSFGNTTDMTILGTNFTSNNNTSDSTSPDGTSYQNKTPKLFGASYFDFRILSADTYVKGRGTSLLTDPFYAFSEDIKGDARANWDIGAHAYVNYSGTLANWNDMGSGTVSDPYLIANKVQLKDIGSSSCDIDSTAGCASHFSIIEGINLNNEAFTPIGETTNVFTGNFNGNNYRIYNLTINEVANDDIGFFGNACGSNISNIIIEKATVSGRSNVGGIVGHIGCGGVIDNVYINNGTVNGVDAVGGIAGKVNGLSIVSNSTNKLKVTGSSSNIGGIVGSFDGGTISNSASIGDVEGDQYVGGAVGNTGTSSNNITNTYATGNVKASTDTAGGFIGRYVTSGSIVSSYALGDVYSTGGIVGGFAGNAGNSATITNSWSGGDVKGNGTSVGGFIGSTSINITDAFSSGNVENVTGQDTGGFVGTNASNTFTRCYSTGNVAANGVNSGGFFGNSTSGIFSNSYASGNVYSTSNDVGGFGGGISLGSISDSYSSGNVFGNQRVGGFIGSSGQATLNRNYSKGSVAGDTDVGGFGGSFLLGSVDDSYAISSVSGGTNIGGFLGASTSDLTNNYASSSVSASISGFAFIGDLNGGTLVENHWNSSESPVDGSNIAIAVLGAYEAFTNTQMKAESNFISDLWDYGSTWTQVNSRGYPIHKTSIEGICTDNPSMDLYSNSGSGSLSDPYVICNKNQFTDIGTNCSLGVTASCDYHFVLGANIDLLGEDYSSKTIGTSSDLFTGSLDGRGHSISNLFSTGDGLFKEAGNGFVIKNLKINSAELNSLASNKSILVGTAQESGVILNTTVSGNMDGGGASAPIVGRTYQDPNEMKKIIVSRVVSNVDISSTSTSSRQGGIIGDAQIGTYIGDSAYYGKMNLATNNSGGIVGHGSGSIIKNKSLGSLVTTGGTIGGILGTLNTGDGIIENPIIFQNYTSMDISGTERVGGAFGYTNDYPYFFNNAVVGGNINGSGTGNGGLIGGHFGITSRNNLVDNIVDAAGIENGGIFGQAGDYYLSQHPASGNFWNIDHGMTDARSDSIGDVTGATGKTTAELDDYSIYNTAGWDIWDTSLGTAALENQLWVMSNNIRKPQLRWMLHPVCQQNSNVTAYNGIGMGTEVDPYLICFKEQLIDMSVSGCDSDSNTGCSSHYLLMNDLDLKGETFFPIGNSDEPFTGVFDGQGHTISNLTISAPAVSKVGLFGYADSATLLNLKLFLVNIEGFGSVGSVAGTFTSGKMINIESSGAVIGYSNTVGGITGFFSGQGDNLKSHVSVSVSTTGPEYIGGGLGIISGASSTISNSFSTGEVNTSVGSARVGGFIGAQVGSTITDSWSSSNVNSLGSSVGGFIGTIGYLLGQANIENCYSLGNVSGGEDLVGGFAGVIQNAIVTNSYASGNVNGGSLVAGGFVGSINHANASVINNYSLGTVTGATVNGGFTGEKPSSNAITNNYWNSDTSGITLGNSAGEYDPLTDAQMDVPGNYTGWDFTNTWRVFTNGYPEIIPIK